MKYHRMKVEAAEASVPHKALTAPAEYSYRTITNLEDPAQRALFDSAYKLYCRSFPKEELDSRASLEEGLNKHKRDQKTAWVVCTDNKGNVVGGTVVSLYETDRTQFSVEQAPHDLAATIGYIFTDKAHRRKGIGSELETKAAEFAGQYNFNGGSPLDKRKILMICNVEDPQKLIDSGCSLKEMARLAEIAQMTPAERLNFWNVNRGYQTLNYPYVLCPRPEPGEEAEPNDALKLRAKTYQLSKGKLTPELLDKLPSAFMNDIVLRWILGAPNRKAFESECPALANNPQVKHMLDWAEKHAWTLAQHPDMDKRGVERGVKIEKEVGLTDHIEKKRHQQELREKQTQRKKLSKSLG